MNTATASYQARRHPVAFMLTFLLLGPYILAAGLLIGAVYAVVATLCVITGNADFLRYRR